MSFSINQEAASFKLSVLDLGQSLPMTIELAMDVDRIGYSRYWLTEHQPQPNPQMTAALVGGVTYNVRVGTAGILLRFHNPLMAAQNFLLLEKVYPGRIDAGFCGGNALGLVGEALHEGRCEGCKERAVYEQKAASLIGFLRRQFPEDHRYATFPQWPQSVGTPQIWNFGTGPGGAELAAKHGIAFGYSIFHNFSRDETTVVENYRQEFRPGSELKEPLVGLAVAGVCAETESQANRLLGLHDNDFIVPKIVGTPQQCLEQLEELCGRYCTQEIVFLDVCKNYDDKRRSYQLLADVCRLGTAGKAVTSGDADARSSTRPSSQQRRETTAVT